MLDLLLDNKFPETCNIKLACLYLMHKNTYHFQKAFSLEHVAQESFNRLLLAHVLRH
uniref:Uncharacterized protein n=1 Tax=Anguilla anguilla TaxID=7936 RepID=A0A0E9Q0Z8_ANGAN